MTEQIAATAGASNGFWRGVKQVALFILIGPPVGGVVIDAFGSLVGDKNHSVTGFLEFLPVAIGVSYVVAWLPALVAGIAFAIVSHLSRTRWPIYVGAVTAGTLASFLLAATEFAAARRPWESLAGFMLAGASAAAACTAFCLRGWQDRPAPRG